MGGIRSARTGHMARPTALLSAVATLLAALFLCLGQAGTDPGPASEHAAHRAGAGFAASSPHSGGHTAETTRTGAPADSATLYSCPYDRGGCGISPHPGPAVLTAPTQDAPPAGTALPRGSAADRVTDGPPRTGALPRAPDLHALQVLRT
ncbi:hypothetical protein [Streptomyces pacificus]|uniref:Uncharacterized protein n=1 Tax=Streptomyces pacificus TaxID=2705029 RepID=A0A6A0ASX5_9ACTN|nr:hypothetical protein [Streptomyces pacificus]GFH34964.1 hypothetical protein SCWH03_11780 [Streptomyces pacificus]